jgi:hypothetical protein
LYEKSNFKDFSWVHLWYVYRFNVTEIGIIILILSEKEFALQALQQNADAIRPTFSILVRLGITKLINKIKKLNDLSENDSIIKNEAVRSLLSKVTLNEGLVDRLPYIGGGYFVYSKWGGDCVKTPNRF